MLADLETERELARRLDLRVAEQLQLRMDSSDSGSECSNVAALSGPAEPITGQ